MKRNKLRAQKIGGTLPISAIFGVVVSVLLSVLLVILVTSLILSGDLPDDNINGYMFVIRAIATLVGSLIAITILKGSYLKVLGLVIAGYLLILITIGIMFYSGSLKGVALGALSVFVGGVSALVIVLRPRGASRKRVKINI